MKHKLHSPAKVNLSLRICKKQGSYHLLETLVSFTDFGDEIIFEVARQDSLKIKGEFASIIQHEQFEQNSIFTVLNWLRTLGVSSTKICCYIDKKYTCRWRAWRWYKQCWHSYSLFFKKCWNRLF